MVSVCAFCCRWEFGAILTIKPNSKSKAKTMEYQQCASTNKITWCFLFCFAHRPKCKYWNFSPCATNSLFKWQIVRLISCNGSLLGRCSDTFITNHCSCLLLFAFEADNSFESNFFPWIFFGGMGNPNEREWTKFSKKRMLCI